jgi:hypothetical protein
MRITEVHLHIRGHRESLVLGHLQPPVPRQRAPQGRWEFPNLPASGGHDSRCVFTGHLDERGKTRMTFHEGSDVTVLGAAKEIVLPMTGNGAVFNFCGPFPNGDGIDDLPARLSANTRVQRAADAALGPQAPHQLFF